MVFNPLITILYNEKLNRWHPILFREAPLPGPPSPDKPIRHKSCGHHTVGFEERADAEAECRKMAEHDELHDAKIIDELIAWDGEEIPAMAICFDATNL